MPSRCSSDLLMDILSEQIDDRPLHIEQAHGLAFSVGDRSQGQRLALKAPSFQQRSHDLGQGEHGQHAGAGRSEAEDDPNDHGSDLSHYENLAGQRANRCARCLFEGKKCPISDVRGPRQDGATICTMVPISDLERC
jgi:hypothetical protein